MGKKGSLFLYKAVSKKEGIKNYPIRYDMITPKATKTVKSVSPESSNIMITTEVVLVIHAAVAAAPTNANPRI